ncbi:MAG: gamma-glutamyltransferase [Pseudomonadota bacterium]
MHKRQLISLLAVLSVAGGLFGCGDGAETPPPISETPVAIEETAVIDGRDVAAKNDAAVAMPDRFAAEAASAVLAEGGNAVDAAVAASFVLAVTLPEAGNLGGGGFMTLVVDGEPNFIDFRETAPASAVRDMYLDEKGEFVSRRAQVGALASGVPGTVRGLQVAHEEYGQLSWARLVAPAIALARDGFEVPPQLAQRIEYKAEFFGEETNFSDYFSAKAGERLVQPELAATLQRIADAGADEFYTGETASMTVAQMRKIDGLITLQDLAEYKAVAREPAMAEWRGRTIVSAPPPSSGGIALLQLLGMKSVLAEAFEGVTLNSRQYVHLVAEMEKRVFADRAEYLGDPDYYNVPVAELTSPDYIARRAAEVNIDAISETDGVVPGLQESFQTTHFSILDFDGNAVAVTTTLNASFGSGVVVEGAGYLLNNEMDDFSAKPGTPNLYGVVGGEANAIAPRKRMLSSMTPTVVMDGENVAMVVGTPGGPTIFTSVFQAIVNHFDYGLPVEEAVAKGRFHHQLLPKDNLLLEERIENLDAVSGGLEEMGYVLRTYSQYGDVHAITVKDGVVAAAHDPRGRGASSVLAATKRKEVE